MIIIIPFRFSAVSGTQDAIECPHFGNAFPKYLPKLKNSLAESFLSPAKCLNFLAGLLANIVLWGWVDVCSLAQRAAWRGSCLSGLYPSTIIPGCFSIQGFGLQKLNNPFGFGNFETKPLICEESMALNRLIRSGVHFINLGHKIQLC